MVIGPGPGRSHLPAVIALIFVAVAIVGLGTGFLIGWAGSGSGPPATAAPGGSPSASRSGSPSPSHSGSDRPRGRAKTDIERGRREDLGYVLGARQEPDGMHLTFDRALLYYGSDARRQAKLRHLQRELKHNRLLVNENPLTRDVVLGPHPKILGAHALAGQSQPRPVSLQRFLDVVAAKGSQLLLDLRYDRLGYLVEIREHDLTR
jgi:hypothetical protein